MFDVAGALTEAANPVFTPAERSGILKYIEAKLFDFENSDNLSFDILAPIIHHLFSRYPPQRREIVAICLCLESLSPESITERFHFDHLICCLLEYHSSSQSCGDLEAERKETLSVIFKYVKLLMELRGNLPVSVVRSMVSVCEAAKPENEPYISLFVEYLCESVLFCDVSRVPELCSVLVAELVKRASPSVLKLLVYAMEMKIPLIRSPKMLWPLLGPLSQSNPNELPSSEDDPSMIVLGSIGYLLKTWPGLMYFGIQGGAIVDLIRCLPKESKSVIKLLRKTLMLESSIAAITDPFSGLLLDALLKEGLIPMLNQLAIKPLVSAFVSEIMPYTMHSRVSDVEMTRHAYQAPNIQTPHIPNGMLFDLSQNAKLSQQIVSVGAVEKMLQLEHSKWDWTALLMVFTVILPHNDREACGAQAQEIYSKMFSFFSGPFLKIKPGKCGSMTEPLFAMLQLLINKKKFGTDIIRSNAGFCNALMSVMDAVAQNTPMESNSPQWALFKSIGLILANSESPEILSGMKSGGQSIWDRLTALCNSCTSEKICSSILDILTFDSFAGNCVPLVQYFLMSENPKVHETAINELRKKRQASKETNNVIFDAVLLTHIASINGKPDLIDRLIVDLNFLAEIITVDESALDMLADGRASHNLDNLLRTHARFVISLMMTHEKMLERPWIDEEIEWWMTTGNREYVAMYDTAVECTFAGTLDVSTTKQPAIINLGGTTTIPPHLFGKMSETEKGFEKILPLIPRLLEKLTSKDTDDIEEIRSILFALGHFAASPYAMTYVEKYKLPEVMMDVVDEFDSYVLRGTLIASLSLIKQSRYVSSVLRARNWQLFRFGRHFSVIPADSVQWLGPIVQLPMEAQPIQDIPKYKEVITSLKMLSNSLVAKQATEQLRTRKTQNDPSLSDPELALFAYNLLAQFYYGPVSRQTLFSLFGSVPLIPWEKNDWSDTLATAQLSASIFAKSDQIEFHSLEEIRAMSPAPRCPECFLSDEDFVTLCSCSRDEFYRKSASEQKEIRQTIFTNQPETQPSTAPD